MFNVFNTKKKDKIELGDVVYDALAQQLKISEKVGVVVGVDRESSFKLHMCKVAWIGYIDDDNITQEDIDKIKKEESKWVLEIELKVLVSVIDE